MTFRFWTVPSLLLSLSVAAVEMGPGTSTARFLLIDPNPRALGMGGLHAAMDRDVFSMWGNPAGLARLRFMEGAGTSAKMFAETTYHWVGVGVPFQSGSHAMAAGFSAALFDAGELEPGVKAEQSLFIGASFASQVMPDDPLWRTLVIGGTCKIVASQLTPEYPSSAGIAFDGGILYRLPDTRLRFGIHFNNLGTQMTYSSGTVGSPLPASIAAGAAYHLSWSPNLSTLFGVEGGTNWDRTTLLHAGAETWISSLIALRFGYQHESEIGSFNTGLGFSWNHLGMDYAFFNHGRLGPTHRASFTFRYGSEVQRSLRTTTVLRSSAKSPPSWLGEKDFTATDAFLSAKGTAERHASVDEAVTIAKQRARTALQQTLAAKISGDTLVMSQDWSGPADSRRDFLQAVNTTLSSKFKEWMNAAVVRGTYSEMIEEYPEFGETDQFANAYVMTDLPLKEFRLARTAAIKAYRDTAPPLPEAAAQTQVRDSLTRIIYRLEGRTEEIRVVERLPADQPRWAAETSSLHAQEDTDGSLTVSTVVTALSLSEGSAEASRAIQQKARDHCLNRFRLELVEAFQRSDAPTLIRLTLQQRLMGYLGEEISASLSSGTLPSPEQYLEHRQHPTLDGWYEPWTAVWKKQTFSRTVYALSKTAAFTHLLQAAAKEKDDTLKLWGEKLQNELR